MDLSFIIPAHNEEIMIAKVIQAIHAAVGPLGREYEVVVADDGSTDRTGEIARENGAKVFRHERRQIAATRNLGWRNSSGAMLIFVDGDTLVTPQCVAEAVAAMDGGAAGGGAPVVFDGQVPGYARMLIPAATALAKWLRLTGGAYLFCKRSALDAVGGWNEEFYAAEEIELAKRLKTQGPFVIVPSAAITSGRKLRTHSGREIFGLFAKGIFRPRSLKDRSSLDFFYGKRRVDPHKSG